MMYWIIEIILVVLIVATIIVTIATILKEKKEYRHLELDDEYGINDDDDYDERPVPRGRKSAGQPAASRKASPGGKRRWKIILEDADTGARYSYIFFDSVGIGRTTKEVAFEEFLSLPDDPKVSKVHCSIIRNQDKLYLKDEGSRNYTFLNGKKIQKPIVIQKDDMISIGETDLEVVKVLREAK